MSLRKTALIPLCDPMVMGVPLERIEMARLRLVLSQSDLADRLQVTTKTLRNWREDGVPSQQFRRVVEPDPTESDKQPRAQFVWERALDVSVEWLQFGSHPPHWYVDSLIRGANWPELLDTRIAQRNAIAQVEVAVGAGHGAERDTNAQITRIATDSTMAHIDMWIFNGWRELLNTHVIAQLLKGKDPCGGLTNPRIPRWRFLRDPFHAYWADFSPERIREVARALGCWPDNKPVANDGWQPQSLDSVLQQQLAQEARGRPSACTSAAAQPASERTWAQWKRKLEVAVKHYSRSQEDPRARIDAQDAVRILLDEPYADEPLLSGRARGPILEICLRAARQADLLGPAKDRVRSAIEAALLCELAQRRFSMAEVTTVIWRRTGVQVRRKSSSEHTDNPRARSRREVHNRRSGDLLSQRTVHTILTGIAATGSVTHQHGHPMPLVALRDKSWSTRVEDLDTQSPR